MTILKRLIRWVMPEYELAEASVFIRATDEKTQYIKLYCKMHGINYVDWFPSDGTMVLIMHKIKTKGWFELPKKDGE